MSDEILAAFAAESNEILEGLEDSIRGLEGGEAEALGGLFRLVHTLKGSASIVGLSRLESFAHAWETRLGKLRSGVASYGPACAGAFLACRDRVARLLESARPAIGSERGEEGGLRPEDEAVLLSLDAAMAAAEASSDSPAAPGSAASPPEGAASSASSSSSAAAQAALPGAVEPAAPREAQAREAGSRDAGPREAGEGRGKTASHDATYARVANSKLEAILSEASELAQSISELGREVRELGDGRLLDLVQALHGRASMLYRNILETRTIPFGEVAERYRRAVLDIARESGKALRFELSGADTEIDKALADRLAEPLLHLVRNAADHGVERPEARLAAGKPREGLVALRARRESGVLVVRVEDDGRGVELDAIKSRAAAYGVPQAEVDSLDEQGLLSLLFRPGFSLSGSVTKWSGRGVGLDAVERNVRAFRGSVRLETRPGRGFAAEVHLPLALSLVEGFTARAGETSLLVPFEAVRSCVSFEDPGDSPSPFRNLPVGGRLVPSIDLGLLYGSPGGAAVRIVALVEAGGSEAGLVLDEVGEALSAAVRPIDRRYADSPGIAGVAALGDGSLVLVLDPGELVRLATSR